MAHNTMPQAFGQHAPVGHSPAAIMVMVEPLHGGGYRLSTPHARGWAMQVQNPIQLARSVEMAFREVQIAAYARAQGKVYDLDGMTMQVAGDPLASAPAARERRPRVSRKPHSPADWQMVANGSWRSPKGRVYGPATQVVQRVVENRKRMGLPIA